MRRTLAGIGHDPSVLQGDDAMVELLHELVLMRDHQHGRALFVDLRQQLHDIVGHLRVDVAGRLVGDDQRRIVHQRPRQPHALLFAAGQLRRIAAALVLQVEQLQNIRHAAADLPPGLADHTHGERHVIVHGHGVDQPKILKNDPHRAAEIRHLPPPQAGQAIVVDDHLAGGGQLLVHDQLEERAFAGAGRTDDKGELAVVDVQVDITQRRGGTPGAVAFIYAPKFDHSIRLLRV